MSEPWTPEDPTMLPTRLAVPKVASALWWRDLGVLMMTSKTMLRPTAVAALDEALRTEGADPRDAVWMVEDRPFRAPALAASWTRSASVRDLWGRIRLRWSLCAYAPQMRVSDGVWTWRRLTLDASQEGPIRPSAEMEAEGRAWAAREGLWWAPNLAAGQLVQPAQLVFAREARAQGAS